MLRYASHGLQRAAGVRACAYASAPPRTLSREVAQHARLRRVHATPSWLESASALLPYGSPLCHRDSSFLRCTATLRRASSGLHRAACVRVCAQANVPPRTLSREVAQHARLRRARAAPRWLGSFHALLKPITPVRRPSSSVHGCTLTCQQWAQKKSQRSRVRTGERATARSLSRGGAARAFAAHARRAALVGLGPCPMKAEYAIETALSLSTKPMLRRASRGHQRPASVSVCAHANAPPRTLCRVVAQHARLRRAHAAPCRLESAHAL